MNTTTKLTVRNVSNKYKLEKRLIRCVRRHRILYDHLHKNFGNIVEKLKVWQNIASSLKMEVEECQSLWFELRFQYQQYVRRLRKYFAKDPKVNKRRPIMRLENEMLFLWNFIDDKKMCKVPYDISSSSESPIIFEDQTPQKVQDEDEDLILVENPIELIVIDEDEDHCNVDASASASASTSASASANANASANASKIGETSKMVQNIKKKFQLTKAMEQLIQHIKPYPELYDIKSPHYFKMERKGFVWQTIANEMNDKATKLMKTWFIMQTRFEWALKLAPPLGTELEIALSFLTPYILDNPNTVYKQSYFLKKNWYEPISNFKDLNNLLIGMRKFLLVIPITESLLNSSEKSSEYLKLWSGVAKEKGLYSEGACETTWLILRQFYSDLKAMRNSRYQLEDKWYFESVIEDLYNRAPKLTIPKSNDKSLVPLREQNLRTYEKKERKMPSSSSTISSVKNSNNSNFNRLLSVRNANKSSTNDSQIGQQQQQQQQQQQILLPPIITIVHNNPIIPTTTTVNSNKDIPTAMEQEPLQTLPADGTGGISEPALDTIKKEPSKVVAPVIDNSRQKSSSLVLSTLKLSCNINRSPKKPLAHVMPIRNLNQPVKLIKIPATLAIVPTSSAGQAIKNSELKTINLSNIKIGKTTTTTTTTTISAATTVTTTVSATAARTAATETVPAPAATKTVSAPAATTAARTTVSAVAATAAPTKTVTAPAATTAATVNVEGITEGIANDSLDPATRTTTTTRTTSTTKETTTNSKPIASTGTSSSTVTESESSSSGHASRTETAIRLETKSPSVTITESVSGSGSTSGSGLRPRLKSTASSMSTSVATESKSDAAATKSTQQQVSNAMSLTSHEILIELIASRNGNILVVQGPPLSERYTLSMEKTSRFVREVMAIPLLHNKNHNNAAAINGYWEYLSGKFNLPPQVCRVCWNFLVENFNQFPKIAPMKELMKPFHTELNVWKFGTLFNNFDKFAQSKGWQRITRLPEIMECIGTYPLLYRDVCKDFDPNVTQNEMEFHCIWRTIGLRFPAVENINEIWKNFKAIFIQYMQNVEYGVNNLWPLNWWRTFAKMKFLVEMRYSNHEPYYYIVHNKILEEIDRCAILEMKNRFNQSTLIDTSTNYPTNNNSSKPECERRTGSGMRCDEERAELIISHPKNNINNKNEDNNNNDTNNMDGVNQDNIFDDVNNLINATETPKYLTLTMANGEKLNIKVDVEAAALLNCISKRPLIWDKKDNDRYKKYNEWKMVAKELNKRTIVCMMAFRCSLCKYRQYMASDALGCCRLNYRYYLNYNRLYNNKIKRSKQRDDDDDNDNDDDNNDNDNRKIQKICIKTPTELNQSTHNSIPNNYNSNFILPERFISDINRNNCSMELVIKNWIYALGNITVNDASKMKLKNCIKKIIQKYIPEA